MDLFNHKRVLELERRLVDLMAENTRLRASLNHAESELKEVLEMKQNIPDSCSPGDYCAACIYSRNYYYLGRFSDGLDLTLTGVMCLKGNACPNFIQKEEIE